MFARARTLARTAWSVLTHQRLAVVAIVVTGLAAIPPEWFSGRWKAVAGVLTGIFAVIAKGSMPVADAIGKVEDDAGWEEADAAIASVPDKVERPNCPAPEPTCKDSLQVPPVPKPEPQPPIPHCGLVGAHITVAMLFGMPAGFFVVPKPKPKPKPKKRRNKRRDA